MQEFMGGNKMPKKTKSNRGIKIIKARKKSYVYIKDGDKDVGILMWHYKKKEWVFKKN